MNKWPEILLLVVLLVATVVGVYIAVTTTFNKAGFGSYRVYVSLSDEDKKLLTEIRDAIRKKVDAER